MLGRRATTAGLANRLGGVEPRHLATLVAVAEAGTFKGAGEQVGYVQSAVSQQIARLEHVIGMPLIVRAPGQSTVALTDAGAIVAHHAAGILAQLDAAAADLRRVGTTELRIGVHDRATMRVLPRAIELLRETAPDVQLILRDRQEPPSARARDVRRGVLDAAIDDLPLAPGPFASVELLRDPIVLLVPPDWPLAARGQLTDLDELATVPLVADESWSGLALLESQLRAAGVEPRYAVHAHLAGSVQALVAAGIGAALVPALSVQERGVAVVDLGERLAPRRIALYWQGQRRRLEALEHLADALLTACAEATAEVVA